MEKDKLQETIQELRNAAATGSPECCALVDKAVGALLDMAAEVEQVKRERDAAVADLKYVAVCETCKEFHRSSLTEPCIHCIKYGLLDSENKYEWRGPCTYNEKKEENNGTH